MRPTLLPTLFVLPNLALAQPNPFVIINLLTGLTTQCQTLMGPANELSVVNAPLLILGRGPWSKVLAGFTEMANTLNDGTSALPPWEQFTSTDERKITDAFRAFGTAETDLLKPVTKVGPSVALVPLVSPLMSGAIGGVADAVEKYVVELIGLLGEDGAGRVAADMARLREALEKAKKAFS